jgi:two-component system nitrate/nitrite response regulator NarL
MQEAQIRQGRRTEQREASLTRREREVLRLLGDGLRAAQIAAALGLSIATVRNHIRAILRKLDSHFQLEAVAEARRRGLL